MRDELPRWREKSEISIAVEDKILRLSAMSSALVAKINRDKDTETDFFTTATNLGREFQSFSRYFTLIFPVLMIERMI